MEACRLVRIRVCLGLEIRKDNSLLVLLPELILNLCLTVILLDEPVVAVYVYGCHVDSLIRACYTLVAFRQVTLVLKLCYVTNSQLKYLRLGEGLIPRVLLQCLVKQVAVV